MLTSIETTERSWFRAAPASPTRAMWSRRPAVPRPYIRQHHRPFGPAVHPDPAGARCFGVLPRPGRRDARRQAGPGCADRVRRAAARGVPWAAAEGGTLASCPINNLYCVIDRFMLFAANRVGGSRWADRGTEKSRSRKSSVRACQNACVLDLRRMVWCGAPVSCWPRRLDIRTQRSPVSSAFQFLAFACGAIGFSHRASLDSMASSVPAGHEAMMTRLSRVSTSRVLHSRPATGTHWTVRGAAAATGIPKSSVQRYFQTGWGAAPSDAWFQAFH